MAGQFSATFVPGAGDDYFMPEVVAPSPQRVTPQVPQNMQEGLQRMELEAREVDPRTDDSSGGRHTREPSLSTYTAQLSLNPSQSRAPTLPQDDRKPYQSTGADSSDAMGPSFSPFPKIKGDNIPPSDDEKEGILWNARKHVLGSQNVSMQITWARDVLNWADISMEAATRESPNQARPPTPRIEHELRTDAVNIITYLAGQEHPQALYIRAKWLEFGKFGNRLDKREAYNGYKRAADLGNARSEYRIGMLYEQSNDISKSKEHYYAGVSLKDSASLYRLGMMSLLGQLGEAKDYQIGLERIKAAADSSDEDSPQGAFVYGMLIGRELPDIHIPESMLPNNPKTALTYIEKSAYLGFARAQHKVGQAYELCQFGCDFNPSYSLHYYGLAAKQGNAEAALGVSRWFLFGFEGVFKKNEELAYKYARQASDAKLATGEFAMGYYHEIGIHVEKSLTEARRWYQIAADHGNKDAIARLESLNQDKTLSKQDHETTTLTRIKSQHGSLRGKRPDRFKQPQQMPTLSEDAPQLPPAGNYAPRNPYGESPRASPQHSPGLRPANDYASYPDPGKPAAFNIRLDGNQAPPARPHSAAPYPVDDRAQLPNAARPRSTAPYPEDDMRGPGAGRPGPGPAYGQGPAADRPGSAFGIKPQGPAGRPLAGSQSMGNLHPAAHGDPRGRVSSGPVAGAYRQPSPGPHAGSQYPPSRPATSQPYPDTPGGGRLQKQPPPGAIPPAGTRLPARPASEVPPHQDPRYARATPVGGSRPGQQGAGGPRPPMGHPAHGPNPGHGPSPGPGGPGRVGSAPPSQMQRPDNRPSPAPSAATAPVAPPKPSKAPTGKGPSTFEDMGIPQGKQDGECIVM